MKLCFMTFVCPTWDLERVVRFAQDTDYDGVEIRVDIGHKHGISSQSSAEERRRSRDRFADAGVEIPCVASSVRLSNPDPRRHAEQLAAARADLDLAADLGAPIVRIFAGKEVPELTTEVATQVAAAFDELGAYAEAAGVCPMLECGHDIIMTTDKAAEIIHRITAPNVGALWNDSNMDDEAYDLLKDRIRHFHIHDEVLDPENTNILHLAKRMKSHGYTGYVSLEIIKGEDLPEDQLRETGSRLKGYITQAYG